jgi:DNA-binding winged helix-turn-helix (wHTH) protein
MPGSQKPEISFACFRLEADGTLLRGETPVHLPPKELAALRLLAANAGRIVTPVQLRQALWGDVHVTADSVPKCVSSLRARLEPEECIQTVYKRGYRFIAGVLTNGSRLGDALPRLAILPFGSGYGVPGHLGSVVAEETMARLSGAQPATVSVLAQDSVFTLSQRGMTAVEVGEALHADLVLAGTLRAMPLHYRLRAEMISVADGTQIWVEDLLVDRSRIRGLESDLANRLAFRLSSGAPKANGAPKVNGALKKPARSAIGPIPSASAVPQNGGLSISAVAEPEPRLGTHRREAYEIFQRAHHEWQTLERHHMQDGLRHLLRATELDPSLIGARIDLVNLCVAQGLYGFMSPIVAADIIRRTAKSTPEFAPRAEAVLPALGWAHFYADRNLPEAISASSLSAHLPHDSWTTRARSMFALSRHRFGEAIDILNAAIRLDPFSPRLQAHLAWVHHLAGNTSHSVDAIRPALRQFPESEPANLFGAIILAFNGETSEAVQIAQRLAQRLPYFDLATQVHAYTLACAGDGDEARTVLERLQWLGRERFLLRAFTPAVYVALGEPDAAIAELRVSNQIRCPWFFQMLADPRIKSLESRHEFQQMRAILSGMEAEASSPAEAAS